MAIQTDTLSSYSLRNGYTDGVMIRRYVPIEEVLLCNLTVALSGNENDLSDSEDEWIVVNRDIKGCSHFARKKFFSTGIFHGKSQRADFPVDLFLCVHI